MSRHTKHRRRGKCRNCAMPMFSEFDEAAKRIAEQETARRIVHVCGGCKAMHYEEAGKLRLLTTGEMFRLRAECPKMVERIEEMPVLAATERPEATVFVSR